jgi:hypothetical protein
MSESISEKLLLLAINAADSLIKRVVRRGHPAPVRVLVEIMVELIGGAGEKPFAEEKTGIGAKRSIGRPYSQPQVACFTASAVGIAVIHREIDDYFHAEVMRRGYEVVERSPSVVTSPECSSRCA